MRWPTCLMVVLVLETGAVAWAQTPTHNLGRTPTAEEIRAGDLFVGPSGEDLPLGKGSAKEGAAIFAKTCAACHGQRGEGSEQASARHNWRILPLVGEGFPRRYLFATTLWSYINSAMPRSLADIGLRGRLLGADEVYALTAFVLYRNGVIQENEVLDAKSLPKIRMPGRDRRFDGLASHH